MNEQFGAISMTDTAKDILQPDIKRASQFPQFIGLAGAVPAQWNNSPFLSGGRWGGGTSAFGANPKSSTKSVLSFSDFMKEHSKLQK
jgi:hypothetical protein